MTHIPVRGRRRSILVPRLVVGLAVGILGCDAVSFPTPPAEEVFEATLAGANEVPAVTTAATGSAQFTVSLDTFLAFRLDVAAIDSTTLAHIHEGAAGVPGNVIVTLFVGPAACRSATGTPINVSSARCRTGFTGELAQGQFKPSQLTQLPLSYGATPRARYDSLLVLMRTGNVYVNVHNLLSPGGHVRGQIQPQ
jgi:hypothetical protein